LWSLNINTYVLIGFSLLAFAANSVLCRLALADQAIDATSFTIIRILSGALVLWLIVSRKNGDKASNSATWTGALSLFVYCAGFSWAYVSMDAGVGALVLFGTVQLVIMTVSIVKKEASHWRTWLGAVLAFVGFAYLVVPSEVNELTMTPWSIGLMMLAGLGWGIYTLNGKRSVTPLRDTAIHFRRAGLFCLPLTALYLFDTSATFSTTGVALAVTSGAITSGLGYAIWYQVLPQISRIQAGVVQLCVPLVAAIGGIVLLAEILTLHFVTASVVLLGGVLLTLMPVKTTAQR
jgi:drug/metabolite transporter (DMT)-like permease